MKYPVKCAEDTQRKFYFGDNFRAVYHHSNLSLLETLKFLINSVSVPTTQVSQRVNDIFNKARSVEGEEHWPEFKRCVISTGRWICRHFCLIDTENENNKFGREHISRKKMKSKLKWDIKCHLFNFISKVRTSKVEYFQHRPVLPCGRSNKNIKYSGN